MASITASECPRPNWSVIAAASVGNALEWFDFVVYGFFATTMAKLFFPTGDDTISLLLALASFGVTFFMRPLGAIVLGSYADRQGRKTAFVLTIRLMMIGTALIAEGFGAEIPKGYIYAAMAFSALVEGLNMLERRARRKPRAEP